MEKTRPKLLKKSRNGGLLQKELKRHSESTFYPRSGDMTKTAPPQRIEGPLSSFLRRRMTHDTRRDTSHSMKTLVSFNRPLSGATPSLISDHDSCKRLKQHRAGRDDPPVPSDRVTLGGDSRLMISPTKPRRFSEDVANRNLDSSYLRLFGSERMHPQTESLLEPRAGRGTESPRIAAIQIAEVAQIASVSQTARVVQIPGTAQSSGPVRNSRASHSSGAIRTSRAIHTSGDRRTPHAILINAGDRRFSEDFADRNMSTGNRASSIPSLSIGQDTAYGYNVNQRAVPLFEPVYSNSQCSSCHISPTTRSPSWNITSTSTPLERTVLSTEEGTLLVDIEDQHREGVGYASQILSTDRSRRNDSGAVVELGSELGKIAVASSPNGASASPWNVGPAELKLMRSEAEALIYEHIRRPSVNEQLDTTKTSDFASKRNPPDIYGLFPAPPRHNEDENPRYPDKRPKTPRRASNKVAIQVVSKEGPVEGESFGPEIWPLRFKTESGSYEGLEQVVKGKRRRMAGRWSNSSTEEIGNYGSEESVNEFSHRGKGHVGELTMVGDGLAAMEKSRGNYTRYRSSILNER